MLVGTGYTFNGLTQTVEVIDLESPPKTCSNLPDFPIGVLGTVGGLDFQERPMICGGNDVPHDTNKCYSYEKVGNWVSSPSLNSARSHFSISLSPFSSNFLVSGGLSGAIYLNTLEELTEQGWQTFLPSLPVTIKHHCSAIVNSTTFMVIAGIQNREFSSNTYYFNSENNDWVQGPHLNTIKASHSCGQIRKDSQSQEFRVIVVGGDDPTVEILDADSNVWNNGPELPYDIRESQLVEDGEGGVLLVGGVSRSDGIQNSIFRLSHGGDDATWVELEQKMKIGRYIHSAFLIPDDIVECY